MTYREGIEFEVATHFLSSLELVASQLSGACATSSPWRWITIRLHDAIYCALVMRLSRTDMFGVYPDHMEKKPSEFYEKGLSSASREWEELSGLQDKCRLADFGTLLKRANLPSGATVHKNVSSSNGLSRSITLLKKRRDLFAHPKDINLFSTDGEFRRMSLDSLLVLQEILNQPSNRYFDYDKAKVHNLISLIDRGLGLENSPA